MAALAPNFLSGRNVLKPLLAAMLLGGLLACAPVTKEQCAIGDWYGLGLSDGIAGRSLTRLEGIQKACAKTGSVVDTVAYQNGRKAGLVQFCTPEKGFSVGSAGRANPNVCPIESAALFNDAYDIGNALSRKRKEISNLESEIRQAGTDLEKTPTDTDAYRALQRQLIRLKNEQNRRYLELGKLTSQAEAEMSTILGRTFSIN